MPTHSNGRRGGFPLPHLRSNPDGKVVLIWPEPKLHSLVFGCNLVSLTRIALARFGDQTPLELLGGYLTMVPVALLLAALASRRMPERLPRLFASIMTLLAMALYSLPGTIPAITPTTSSNLVAVGTMASLATGTALAELLYRFSGRPPAPRPAVRRVYDG